MNFDVLAEDLWREFRKVKTETRYGCDEDGGVVSIVVREGARRYTLWQEPRGDTDELVVKVKEDYGITTTRKSFQGRDRAAVVAWMTGRARP